jgi:ribosome biogenesis GTPase
MRGLVIRSQSGFFTVKTETGKITCRLRGRLLKGRRAGDVVAVGDWVSFTLTDPKVGVIEEIEPRKSLFSRLAPNPHGLYQQILIANPDQIVLVFSCAEPVPRLGMLDRFLVIAEKNNVPAVIVANKTDLVGLEQAQQLFGHYSPVGYPVIYTSTRLELGVEKLKNQLQGRISLLAGPSGVGKSSLLNKIQPGLGLAVRQVSHSTSKGRHTTVVRELFELEEGGYVADTPGLKALALWDVEPEEIDAYFPEIRIRVPDCQFSDCTHVHEPGCAVLSAIQAGKIHPLRYQSYIRMRFGELE